MKFPEIFARKTPPEGYCVSEVISKEERRDIDKTNTRNETNTHLFMYN